ncbi:MAG: hypothetical protein C5B50_13130 [Verrucomicrobia bacterium]|nr:MAG: hypothetical protein C5B50_13130 [Verrucomicrobiota bacterium]
MKMVFFSSDRVEVEMLSKELNQAGIPCEVRSGVTLEDGTPSVPEAELWVQHDHDRRNAYMFCVEREIGFAKRGQVTTLDDLDEQEIAA